MLALRLGWRSFARHKRRSIITAAAISLGLAMLIVFTGIIIDGHDKMTDMGVRLGSGHVVVQGAGFQDEQTLDYLVRDPDAVEAAARNIAGVDQVVRRVYSGGLVASGELSAAVMIAGVDPRLEPEVSDIASPKHRTAGDYLRARDQLDFESDPGDIYIGDKLARTLDVELDDRVVLTASPAGVSRPASAAFRVRGVFHTGVGDLDGFYVQVSLTDSQQLLALDGSVTQVAVLLRDLRDTPRVAAELQTALGARGDLEILPWQEALRELYEALVLDDIANYMIHAIVFLIVAIGIFNTILMSVIERTRELGVMIAIGTSGRRIFATIMAEAVVLAVVACAIGLAIGLSLHYWIATTGLDVTALYGEDFEFAGIVFEGRIYSKLYAGEVATWTAIVFGIVLASSLYPAVRATRLQPAKAMRHA